MTTGKNTNFTIDREDVEVVCFLVYLDQLLIAQDPAVRKYDTDWKLAEQNKRAEYDFQMKRFQTGKFGDLFKNYVLLSGSFGK